MPPTVVAVQDNLLTSFNILKVGCPMLAEQGETDGSSSSSAAMTIRRMSCCWLILHSDKQVSLTILDVILIHP
jgi:hypothetical protein